MLDTLLFNCFETLAVVAVYLDWYSVWC